MADIYAEFFSKEERWVVGQRGRRKERFMVFFGLYNWSGLYIWSLVSNVKND